MYVPVYGIKKCTLVHFVHSNPRYKTNYNFLLQGRGVGGSGAQELEEAQGQGRVPKRGKVKYFLSKHTVFCNIFFKILNQKISEMNFKNRLNLATEIP